MFGFPSIKKQVDFHQLTVYIKKLNCPKGVQNNADTCFLLQQKLLNLSLSTLTTKRTNGHTLKTNSNLDEWTDFM